MSEIKCWDDTGKEHSPCKQDRMQALDGTIQEELEAYEAVMMRRGLGENMALNNAKLVPIERYQEFQEDYAAEVTKWADHGIDIRPLMKSLFMLNGLTEENLPNYSTQLGLTFDGYKLESMGLWIKDWNASEQQHGPIISRLVEASGVVDYENEYVPATSRNMRAGIHPQFEEPEDGFAYLTPQELATKISHHFLSQMLSGGAGEAVGEVQKDEALHYAFYRKMLKVSAEMHPDVTLSAVKRQFVGFAMPGQKGIKNYNRHALNVAAAGGFDSETTVGMFKDILKAIGLEGLQPQTGEGKAIQEELMAYSDLSSEVNLTSKKTDERIRDSISKRNPGARDGMSSFVLGRTVELVDGNYQPMAA